MSLRILPQRAGGRGAGVEAGLGGEWRRSPVTAGVLNFNAFGHPIAVERFVAPGAPIGGWGGGG